MNNLTQEALILYSRSYGLYRVILSSTLAPNVSVVLGRAILSGCSETVEFESALSAGIEQISQQEVGNN